MKKNQINDFQGKSLKNKIALIKRGEIEFKDKKINAQNRGAAGVIIYNLDNNETILEATAFDKNVLIPSIFIKNSDGLKLRNLCDKGVTVSFQNQLLERNNDESGCMSDFSSWGPAPNLDLKPDITGVGGAVWSTVNDNSYKNMSGTSMATPYVSGTSALLMQHINKLNMKFKNEEDKVKLNKTLLMNTAEIKMNKEHGVPYSPRQQGAGFVNLKDALKNKVTVTYKGDASVSLGVLTQKNVISMDIKNYGDVEVSYKVSNPYGILTECNESKNGEPYDIKLDGASMEFQNEVIKVKPGETVSVNATLKLDDSVTKDRFVEGYISFISEGDIVPLNIPYMGYYGDWSALPVLDNPIYTGKSVIGETTLVGITEGFGGYQSYYIGAGKDSKPEYFAINPDDSYAISNVAPQITLLRNAKYLKVDVTDKEGKFIRTLHQAENVRKEVFAENTLKARVQNEWKWDGTVYDSQKGQRVSVPEGQYSINIRVMADAKNAKEQVISFPVKIDKTSPILKNNNIVIADSSQCNLELEAYDGEKGAGISDFVFIVNDKDYVDANGKKSFKLKEQELHKYYMNLELPENNNPVYRVYMGCVDYARNITPGETVIVNSAKSHLKINLDKQLYEHSDEIKLNYNIEESSKESQVDHYEISLDNASKVVYSGKNKYYTMSNLHGGEHYVLVKAMNSKNEIVDANAIKFNVKESPSNEYETRGIRIWGLDQGILYEDNYATFSVKATNITGEDKDVTLMMCVYDHKGNMVNSSIASKTICAHGEVVLKNSVCIESGHTIKVFVWDNIYSQIPYVDKQLQLVG
ncbi:PA domain-containing protein [Hathewaya proteolytica DSM 3090]|uniref:PA domain-containing protein n=1 Tax=Hathewaya proteolytica DSM 3090 TaxID=1121331 RepID=A0A1M6PL38_9CLOT|nr:S8 family serine peptidase [Hathewaya proteolytica]SHK08706.1 PA domain-containing protein [Hathewaya proteolytica DSM 3090]